MCTCGLCSHSQCLSLEQIVHFFLVVIVYVVEQILLPPMLMKRMPLLVPPTQAQQPRYSSQPPSHPWVVVQVLVQVLALA